MPAGITFTTNMKGDSFVTINLKKYGDKLQSFFREEGVEEEATKALYGKKFIRKMAKSKEAFERGEYETIDMDNLDKLFD